MVQDSKHAAASQWCA